MTNLPGFPTGTGSPYGMFFADLQAGVGYAGTTLDTVYVADDGAAQGIVKYSFDGTNWAAKGNVSIANNGLSSLTGVVSGTTVTLYASSGGGTTRKITSLTDASGYNNTITGTHATVFSAPANTAYRGVAFVPTVVSNALVSLTPSSGSISTSTVTYTATFKEATTNPLATGNLAISFTGGVTGTVGTPTTSDSISSTIPVSGIAGIGTLRVDMTNSTGWTTQAVYMPTKGDVVNVSTAGADATLDVDINGKVTYLAGVGKLNNATLSISGSTYTISDPSESIFLTANVSQPAGDPRTAAPSQRLIRITSRLASLWAMARTRSPC